MKLSVIIILSFVAATLATSGNYANDDEVATSGNYAKDDEVSHVNGPTRAGNLRGNVSEC